ncbi:unnamed protein product [Brassica oleracea var. botrytis]
MNVKHLKVIALFLLVLRSGLYNNAGTNKKNKLSTRPKSLSHYSPEISSY